MAAETPAVPQSLQLLGQKWNQFADDWSDGDMFDFVEGELIPELKKFPNIPGAAELLKYNEEVDGWDAGDIVDLVASLGIFPDEE